jgi:hypothetical protein
MSFLAPLFLAGAALVAIPIVLHMLRRDIAPEVPFSAVRLLQKSPVERSKRRRLRDLLLLAARVAALLLLAAAFARPYSIGAAAKNARLRIVAIDRSLSMGTPQRFAQALDVARQAIDEAGGSDRVAVIVFDDRADVIAQPGSAAAARASLAGLTPGFGATRFSAAIARAAEIADGDPGTLILISDLQRAGWEEEPRALLPASLALQLRPVGPAVSNVAVQAVRVEKDRVVATIRAAGAARIGTVRVATDGGPEVAGAYSALADNVVDVSVPYRAASHGVLRVSVDDPQGIPGDNVRYAVLDPVSRARVLLVTTGGATPAGFYLAKALESTATDAGSPVELQMTTGSAVASMSAEALSRYAAVVLLSTRGLERHAGETVGAFVRRGGGLLVAAAPDVEPSVLASMFGWKASFATTDSTTVPSVLSVTDLRHPIFRPFGALAANLGQVRFDHAWKVHPDGWTIAARFTDGTPALVERHEDAGRIVLFASDVDRRWNDFPLHPSFVPFTVEAVRYVCGSRDDASDYVVARAPQGARPEPGVYKIAGDRSVAVNVDPRESATAAMNEDDFRSMVEVVNAGTTGGADARAQETENRQGYWRYGLMLMLAALVAESFIGKA